MGAVVVLTAPIDVDPVTEAGTDAHAAEVARARASGKVPLAVGLGGTLVRSDLLFESLFVFVSGNLKDRVSRALLAAMGLVALAAA